MKTASWDIMRIKMIVLHLQINFSVMRSLKILRLYLNRLNKRIDILVDAWKKAENMMSKMGDHKIIMEQAMKLREQMQKENEDKGKNGSKENDGSKNKEEKTMYTNS